MKTKSASKAKSTWREKFKRPQEPQVKPAPEKWSEKFGKKMLIPTPALVDETVRKVGKGKLVTLGQIRTRLAKKFNADFTCPLTTGIFLRIVAEVAEEDKAGGKKRVAPYWRVLKDDGTLNPKFPGGDSAQANYLRQEGFSIVKKGKTKLKVKDFESYLVDFS